jgi:hypothetical protein
MRPNHQSIVRALRRTASVSERFWASVRRSESEDGCWEWTGSIKPGDHPAFSVGKFTITAPRVAWFVETGDLPESLLNAMTDGYRHLSDNPSVQLEATSAPRVFRPIAASKDEAA